MSRSNRRMGTITRNKTHISKRLFSTAAISCIFCLVTALLLAMFSSMITGNATFAQAATPKYLVAQDGNGNYTTIQAAVNAVPANNTQPVVIYIKNGTYSKVVTIPKNKPFITFYGQNKNKTIISYNNYASKPKPGGGTYGTSGSATMFVNANDFTATNLTIQNTHGAGSQAVALYVTSDRDLFTNVQILGRQDTLYADGGRQYYNHDYIAGSVDFIFGNATAVFEDDELHNVAGGSVTAQSRTSASQTSGYVLIHDQLTRSSQTPAQSTILGRPWRPYSRVVYLSCSMDSHITPTGWDDWDNPANQQTAFFAEYNSTGHGANPTARVPWSKQLTKQETTQFSVSNFLNQDGWLTTAEKSLNSLLKIGFPQPSVQKTHQKAPNQ